MRPEEYAKRLGALYKKMDASLRLELPITEASLANTEKELGFTIDPDLRAYWLYANGGEADYPFFVAREGYYTVHDFLSIESAINEREHMASRAHQYADYEDPRPRDKRIKNSWYEQGWLPFGNFGGGSLLLISDLSPSRLGKVGQVIGYVHDPDEIVYVADSFSTLLKQSIEELENRYEEYLDDVE